MRQTVIIGGNGKTGSRVARRLEDLGRPVVRTSRSASPPFDWNDRRTWAAALSGSEAAYITYAPDIALPGALSRVEALIGEALELGVRRLVLLSGRGEEEAQKAEDVLMGSDADWTIVRASWFAQNFSEGFFADHIGRGQVYWPSMDVLEPFIDVDDIADVVAASLADDRHVGQLYEVTGPRLMTFPAAIREIAEAIGREVKVVPVPVEGYLDAVAQEGTPAEYVELLRILTTEVLDGRNAYLADGVDKALGRPPRDFAEFVARTFVQPLT